MKKENEVKFGNGSDYKNKNAFSDEQTQFFITKGKYLIQISAPKGKFDKEIESIIKTIE